MSVICSLISFYFGYLLNETLAEKSPKLILNVLWIEQDIGISKHSHNQENINYKKRAIRNAMFDITLAEHWKRFISFL